MVGGWISFTETLFPGASCWFQGGYHPQKYKRSTISISIHVLHLSVYFEPSFRFLPRKSGGNSDSEIWQASVQPNSSITLKSFTVPCIRTWKIFHFEGLQGDLSVFTGEAVERGEACGVFFSNTLLMVFSDLSKKPKRGGFQLPLATSPCYTLLIGQEIFQRETTRNNCLVEEFTGT